jgi:hypothetical protein
VGGINVGMDVGRGVLVIGMDAGGGAEDGMLQAINKMENKTASKMRRFTFSSFEIE